MNKTDINLNWPLLGNLHIVNFLSKSILNNRISGTYIFAGPDDLGKTTIANYFAYSLLCQGKNGKLPCGECPACNQNQVGKEKLTKEGSVSVHADFHVVKREKDKKNISIEQIREFIRSLEMSSFLNSYKIGIIKHAESLSEEAANALLKTLEEPKKSVVVILITSELESLPKTIISRSQVLRFFPVKMEVIYNYLINTFGVSRSLAKNLSRISLGRPALAVKFLEDKDFYETYLKRVKAFLAFGREDINSRFALVNDLFDSKITGQEATKLAARILSVWQGMLRDLFLVNLGEIDLVQHEVVINELQSLKSVFSLARLVKLSELLTQAEVYLKSNVNPRLVLEEVAMSI